MFRFRNFKVYKDAKEFHKLTVRLTSKFPKEFDYLTRQLRRAALSIVLNIAEGSAKKSDKDFNRYLLISLGSINEVVAGFEIAFDSTLVTNYELEEIIKQAEYIASQLGGFSKKLTNKS